MVITIAEVVERMSDVVAALDATAYQRNAGYTDTWNAAEYPFSPAESPDSVAHLSYVVVPTRSRSTGRTRDFEHDLEELETTVEIQFCYYLRPESQVADLRLATNAARDIVRAIARESHWGTSEVNVQVETRWEYRVIPDESWIGVVTSFRVQHEELL